MVKELGFGWGNPYFLLEVLEEQYKNQWHTTVIDKMYYPPREGDETLINYTRKVIRHTMGINYDVIIPTNGATHAINVIMRVLNRDGYNIIATEKFGYPSYGEMIRRAGLRRIMLDDPMTYIKQINLIDSPGNPFGNQSSLKSVHSTIWDSVYHSKVYGADINIHPSHTFMVGSYSKLLGIAGARIGYIAMHSKDNPMASYIDDLKKEAWYNLAGVSKPSTRLVLDILKDISLDKFMERGNTLLNYNKSEFSKVLHLFDNQPQQEVGMFYCAQADKKTLQLLKKCGITYVELGDDFIRLSMGQKYSVTREAVKRLLKEDKA